MLHIKPSDAHSCTHLHAGKQLCTQNLTRLCVNPWVFRGKKQQTKKQLTALKFSFLPPLTLPHRETIERQRQTDKEVVRKKWGHWFSCRKQQRPNKRSFVSYLTNQRSIGKWGPDVSVLVKFSISLYFWNTVQHIGRMQRREGSRSVVMFYTHIQKNFCKLQCSFKSFTPTTLWTDQRWDQCT